MASFYRRTLFLLLCLLLLILLSFLLFWSSYIVKAAFIYPFPFSSLLTPFTSVLSSSAALLVCRCRYCCRFLL